MSNNYTNLIEKAKKAGIDVDEIVFSVNIADIIGEISATHHAEDISIKKLKELIATGIHGTDQIAWSIPVYEAINNEAITINENT